MARSSIASDFADDVVKMPKRNIGLRVTYSQTKNALVYQNFLVEPFECENCGAMVHTLECKYCGTTGIAADNWRMK